MQIGPYFLQDELGRGGAGSVLRAQHVTTGQKVAIKVLEARSAQGRARFEREVAALARLSHPGVVRLLDSGWVQDRPYLVMELIVGVSLQQHLDRRGALGSERVAELAEGLAEALQHVHTFGLLHRDLKPDNVLLAQDGRAILADFGLVKDLGAESEAEVLSRTGVCMGTPGFWAPEQALGARDRLGPATDVYGLGAILYAALTRSPPFAGASLAEVLVATSNAPLIPPSEHGVVVDPSLEAIVLRCLARDPGDRFPTALALRQALAGRSDTSSSRGPLVLGISLGLASLGVGAALTLALLRPSPPPSPTSELTPARSDTATPTPAGARADLAKFVEEARAQAEARDAKGALRTLDAALVLDPDSTEILALRAQLYLSLRRAGDASRDLQRAIGLDPRDPSLHCQLAVVSEAQGLPQSAERSLSEALRLDPQRWEALYRRAILRGQLGRSVEALEDFRHSLELHPDPQTYTQRGNLLAHLGRAAEAEADLNAALAFPTTDKTWIAHYRRGRFYEDKQDFPKALADYSAALKLHPREPELLGSRAMLYRKLGDLRSSLKDLNAALAEDPSRSAILLNRSGVRGDLGDHAGALRDLDEVIRRDPSNGSAYYNRGYVRLIDLKDPQAALPDLQRAVQLLPKDSASHYSLGVAHLHLGDERAGALAFEQSLRFNPKRVMHEKIRRKVSQVLGRPSRY